MALVGGCATRPVNPPSVYESSFLERNVQGELVSRALNPFNWSSIGSTGWGRSALRGRYVRRDLVQTSDVRRSQARRPEDPGRATDLADGTRLVFNPENSGVLARTCRVRAWLALARRRWRFPVVLSSITIDNYGRHC